MTFKDLQNNVSLDIL